VTQRLFRCLLVRPSLFAGGLNGSGCARALWLWGCYSWRLSHNRNKIAVVPIAILEEQSGLFTASVGVDSDAGFDCKAVAQERTVSPFSDAFQVPVVYYKDEQRLQPGERKR